MNGPRVQTLITDTSTSSVGPLRFTEPASSHTLWVDPLPARKADITAPRSYISRNPGIHLHGNELPKHSGFITQATRPVDPVIGAEQQMQIISPRRTFLTAMFLESSGYILETQHAAYT